MEPAPPVTILGVEYPALADGKYDAVILGTGLKECIVAGLLATEGKKVWIPVVLFPLGPCPRPQRLLRWRLDRKSVV